MGHLTALKDLRQKGFVIPGSDGTVNLGAYSEAAEKLWRKARAQGQGDIHVATSPARLRGCATPSAGLARWAHPRRIPGRPLPSLPTYVRHGARKELE